MDEKTSSRWTTLFLQVLARFSWNEENVHRNGNEPGRTVHHPHKLGWTRRPPDRWTLLFSVLAGFSGMRENVHRKDFDVHQPQGERERRTPKEGVPLRWFKSLGRFALEK
ncbi:hypothetical protein NPIL_135211, partial [Nephila pilipes]